MAPVTLSTRIDSLLSTLQRRWTVSSPWARVFACMFLITATWSVVKTASDYRKWKALGPGGLPYNFGGYVLLRLVTMLLAKNNTTSLDFYDHPGSFKPYNTASPSEQAEVLVSILGSLPQRGGIRARAIAFIIPQREKNASESGDQEVREAYMNAVETLGHNNSQRTEWRTSVLERRGRALFRKPSVSSTPLTNRTSGEICHVHASDLSGHISLSYPDCREIIEKGWGERHRLSGTRFLPENYVMLYSPRSVEEIEVFVSILQAGVDYMCGE